MFNEKPAIYLRERYVASLFGFSIYIATHSSGFLTRRRELAKYSGQGLAAVGVAWP